MSELAFKELEEARSRIFEKDLCVRCGLILSKHPWKPKDDPRGNFVCPDGKPWYSAISFRWEGTTE